MNGRFFTSSPRSLTVLSTPPEASHNPPLILLCYLIVCPFYTPRHLILSLTFSPLPLPGQPARHGVNAILRSLHPTYLAVSHSLPHTLECSRTHMFWPHYTLQPHLKLLMLKHSHTHALGLAGWVKTARAEKIRVQSMSIDMQYCTKTTAAQTSRENQRRGKSSVRKGEYPHTWGSCGPIYMNNLHGSRLKHHMFIKTLKICAIIYFMFLFNFPAKIIL